MAKNRVIGRGTDIPWQISEDFTRMKSLTLGHPVIIGQITYDAILKLQEDRKFKNSSLPGRTIIVLSLDKQYKRENVQVANSIEEALNIARGAEGSEEIFILGGSMVFGQFLPLSNKLYLTIIDKEVVGDKFFPEFNENEWKIESRAKRRVRFDDFSLKYDFVNYVRS